MTIYKNLLTFFLALSLGLTACHKKPKAIEQGDTMTIKNGSTVSMNYTLKVDGKVVDSSEGKEPLTYVQGSGQIIIGLEKTLEGLKAGDKKNVTVSPEEGYGIKDPNAFQKVPKSAFKDSNGMKVGSVVAGKAGEQEFQAVVSSMDKDEITLDFNHPLAGKTLNFAVEIVDVK